jgi:hypothetical protein
MVFYRRILSAAPLFIAPFLASCWPVNIPPVDDITLVSVDVLEGNQVRDPGDALGDALSGAPLYPKIRITFSTRDDYQKIAVEHDYYIGNMIGMCSGSSVNEDRALRGGVELYDQKAMIDVHRPAQFGLSNTDDPNRILYHAYFDPRYVETNPLNLKYGKKEYSYDLTRAPEDICFNVGGGKNGELVWPWLSFETNVVRIPRAMLVAALMRAHLKCLASEPYCVRPSKNSK